MPRPRVRLSRSNRIAEIMAAAREAITEANGREIAMSEIAERIGVVEGAIYRLFPTKHQLMIAVMCDWYQEIMLNYETGLAEVSGVRERLRFVSHHHIRCVYSFPEMVTQFFSSIRMSADYRSSELFRLNRRYASQVIRILEDGVRSGELRPDRSPRRGRDMLFGFVEQATWEYRMGLGDLDPEALADEVTDLIYDAFVHRPAPAAMDDAALRRQLLEMSETLRALAEGNDA
ncbi:MAG: TetR/AcrR family transcriptional regulator [Pseudodonghicola sp.]